ncbi:TPA: toxin-antitoxin system HicB family antitoxin [Campylobacter jejuni]|uniref:toxin-antitoxin system HicB family antitoxin n=1 Tax=Campylobacter TaxID=194 RepID=UPI0006999DBF|nr:MULTISPECIES: toxin-antitoxin system HicB family antitoxin [Campylobacter]MCE4872401.1 type II toxin-antitoxin system HicB family antitoxin [Campylobacter coli]MCE4874026.1 type II toxin-antitoxin system HicB family antitoxin [Campylobacter coli]MCE7285682.1 type II toxin-antitoxin system HicB family antitoxin [Campylobacter coli]MCH3766969.1 type II toxin-antitoxin system HicB family antitoxin [Campylobacter coli]MCH3772344.1 type II toxin-antitoxin system HicB family antitoxin [Campylobac
MNEKDFIEISKKFMDEHPTKFLNPNKEKYYEKFYKYCENNNLEMDKNTAYMWLLDEAEKNHPDIMITNPNATKKDIEKDKKKMAEEKESKGSYNLQIKIPNELKDKLEKKAEKAGVSLNQYIMYLFIDDIKNERI